MSAKSPLVSRASVVVLGLEHSHVCPCQKMLTGRLLWLCFSVSLHLVGRSEKGAVPLNNSVLTGLLSSDDWGC